MEKTRVWEYVKGVGETVMKDWTDASEKYGLKGHASGFPCLAHFDFDEDKLEMKTLFTRLMLKEGFLSNTAIYPTLAHTDDVLAKYRVAIDKVFSEMSEIVKKGGKEAVLEAIEGKVCQTGFKRLLD